MPGCPSPYWVLGTPRNKGQTLEQSMQTPGNEMSSKETGMGSGL